MCGKNLETMVPELRQVVVVVLLGVQAVGQI